MDNIQRKLVLYEIFQNLLSCAIGILCSTDLDYIEYIQPKNVNFIKTEVQYPISEIEFINIYKYCIIQQL